MGFNPNQPRDDHGQWTGDMIERLTHYMKRKGVPHARAEAVAHLQKSGVLYPGTENLTPEGIRRTQIGAAERAKERAARYTGKRPEEFGYQRGRVFVK